MEITESMKAGVRRELLQMNPHLVTEHLEILVRLCYLLVEIDNSDMLNLDGYALQDAMIEFAREHNGKYGI